MRWDEAYNNPDPSDQLQLMGLGLDGERDVAEAERWILDHANAWDFMVSDAYECFNRKGYVPMKKLVEDVRFEMGVSVKNGYAPAFSRIMERREPRLKGAFKKHASKADGYA